jgi:AraC family transcriptional regulator, transcriptional activator of pobA
LLFNLHCLLTAQPPAVPASRIQHFQDFNAFHRMANGALQTRHEDIQVFTFAEIGKDAVQDTPLFKTSFYQIGLFSKVQFEVSHFGNSKIVDQKNAVVLFKPGQTCAFSKSDPNASGYAIMFQEHFIDWRLNNSNTLRDFSILNPQVDCVLFLDDPVFADLLHTAERMHAEYRRTLDDWTLNILKLYAHILIEKINRISKHSPQPATSIQFKTTQDFKNLVYRHLHETKTVSDYADMLCITEKTLIKHLRHTMQTTPTDFINHLIVAESKAMLQRQASVDEVAAYFNFTDQAHFSNFFRNKTGQNPARFKKQ